MKFRRKPVVVDAIQYKENKKEIIEFSNCEAYESVNFDLFIRIDGCVNKIEYSDWLIKHGDGTFELRESDVFKATYEKVE